MCSRTVLHAMHQATPLKVFMDKVNPNNVSSSPQQNPYSEGRGSSMADCCSLGVRWRLVFDVVDKLYC